MGSRLKENPERTFNWFFEASCPIAKDKDPEVLFQFPEAFDDEESVCTLPRFCFPYDIERVKTSGAVQHFTFALTDLEGCQRFGFCRQTPGSRTCLCILSYLPWFEVFYKLLNNLADYLAKGQTNEMRELLSVLYKHPVPQPDSIVTLQLVPYFIAPDPRSLPSVPENRNLTELVVAVDVNNLLQLYGSMLFERRILIISSKLSTLTACVHACCAVLFPMYWQHIFIPVLPPHLLDYCCAPMPYLIGVHSSLSEKVRSRALEEVVILNVDKNTIESPFDDLKRIPSDVVSGLKMRLKKQSATTGTGVARAFLRAQALLFGGYRDALICPLDGGPVTFCEKLFLDHKSHSMKQFLQCAVHLQFFKQFIDGRLELMNSRREPVDLFEAEILQCNTSAAGSKSYQQWVGNLKKGGGALILTVKSKTNIYKAAKDHVKAGWRNIAYKDDSNDAILYRVGSLRSDNSGVLKHRRVQSDSLQNRLPITQHFGKSRPRRPAPGHTGPSEDHNASQGLNKSWNCTWESGVDNGEIEDEQMGEEIEVLEPDCEQIGDSEEMDLLGEIFDTLSARSSHERGLLYGTRSLDLFGPDSSDYITRHHITTPSQESLSPSTGRSGSLLSWGQEASLEEEQDVQSGDDQQIGEQQEGVHEHEKELSKEVEQRLAEPSVEEEQKGLQDDTDDEQNCLKRTTEDTCERIGEIIEKTMENSQKDVIQDGNDEQIDSEVSGEEHQNQARAYTDYKDSTGHSNTISHSSGIAWEWGTYSDSQLGQEANDFPSEFKFRNAEACSEASPLSEDQPDTAAEIKGSGLTPTHTVQEAVAVFQVRSTGRQLGAFTSQNSKRGFDSGRTPPPVRALRQPGPPIEEDSLPPVKVCELKKRFEA